MRLQTYNSGIALHHKKLMRVALMLYVAVCVNAVWSQGFSGPEAELAEKILAITGPGAMAVTVTNRSGLGSQTADEIRRGLLTELASRGERFANAEQATATVEIFLSENEFGYLWIARIQQGTSTPAIVMASVARPTNSSLENEKPRIKLVKTLLWAQPERILDVAVLESNPAHMAVLSGNEIAVYRIQGERPQLEQSLPIAHQRPWPRDLRGRLHIGKEHLLEVFLPGVRCQSSSTPPLSLNCRESDDPWPLGSEQFRLNAFFTPSRNFFTGALSPPIGGKQNSAPFYSAAPVPRDRYTLWIFTSVGGQIHFLDGVSDQVAGKVGWGSDIAGVRSACGTGWQVLATSSNDNDDAATAFEIADRTPVAVSEPLPFIGSITAFWPEFGGSGVIAVAHNFVAGTYEAYRLTVSCDNR